MKISSLQDWKEVLSQPTTASSPSLRKILKISRDLLADAQDPELTLLVGKHVYKAALLSSQRCSVAHFVAQFFQRLNNLFHHRGFITEIEDGIRFVRSGLDLDTVPPIVSNYIHHNFRSNKSVSLKAFSYYTQNAPKHLQTILATLEQDESSETKYFLWLVTHDLTSLVSPKKKDDEDEFVGVISLKAKQKDHLKKLKHLAATGDWESLQHHTSHPDSGFDWWMFPTTWESASYKKAYQLSDQATEQLKNDQEFMSSYLEGVALVARSWGWDIAAKHPIADPKLQWRKYNVRLEKMIHSLHLFDQKEHLKSLKLFVTSHKIRLAPWAAKYLA